MKKSVKKTQPEKKQKSPQKISKSPPKHTQIDRIKTNVLPRVLRWILWLLLGFIFLRGVVTIVTQKPEDEIILEQRHLINQAAIANDKTFLITSFAEGFIKNYCTYSAQSISDYKSRISHFMTQSLSEEMMEGVRLIDDADAVYTNAVSVNKQNENQFDVVVMADVLFTKYPNLSDKEVMNTNPFTQRKTLYYTVPIFYKDNRCIVEDFPFVSLMPEKYENYETTSANYLEVNAADRAPIETLINDFSKSLFEDSQSKINYYLANIENVKKFTALNGAYKLIKVELGTVCLLADNKYLATASITIQDANESVMKQKIHFRIVKQDRYLIEDMGLRIRNLDYIGG